jgi:GNAT superfamily N-acetyltransferase
MSEFSIGLADGEAAEYVTSQLKAFNDANCPASAARRLIENDPFSVTISAKSESGKIIGGVVADVWQTWKWLYVQILWVDESYRGTGIGTALMDAIEAEGVRHGCTRARLTSWSFQSPEFYKRRGYIEYGLLPNFPDGFDDHLLWKPLI